MPHNLWLCWFSSECYLVITTRRLAVICLKKKICATEETRFLRPTSELYDFFVAIMVTNWLSCPIIVYSSSGNMLYTFFGNVLKSIKNRTICNNAIRTVYSYLYILL